MDRGPQLFPFLARRKDQLTSQKAAIGSEVSNIDPIYLYYVSRPVLIAKHHFAMHGRFTPGSLFDTPHAANFFQ